eukprot:5881241-Pyramimonas_sp.AAC.1
MMMYLTRAKQEVESVARENRAISDVLDARKKDKRISDSLSNKVTTVKTDRAELDSKGQKVMDVFKQRKEHQEMELKSKLKRLVPKTETDDVYGESKSVVPYSSKVRQPPV